MRLHCVYGISLFVTLALLLPAASAQQRPLLAGTVHDTGGEPVRKARVELLAESGDEVKFYTYTDNDGNYAFRNARPGVYRVQVKLGTRVLRQKAENGSTTPSRKIRVTETPARLKVVVQV
jgi:hypothetical protein